MKRCVAVVFALIFVVAMAACSQADKEMGASDEVTDQITYTNSSGPELDTETIDKLQTPGKVVHTYSDGTKLVFTNFDGNALPEDGDIIFSRTEDIAEYVAASESQIAGITAQGFVANVKRWPGRVPYVIHSNVQGNDRAALINAIKAWNDSDVWLKLTPKISRYEPEIVFKKVALDGSCGNSWVGQNGGFDESQPVNIDCFTNNTIHHEIGHAVGLLHEHQRCDRNNFVTVYYTGFSYERQCSRGNDYGPYNYNSMMHYGASLTSNRIRTRSKSELNRLGYRSGVDYVGNPEGAVGSSSLGSYDIRTINGFYGLYNPPTSNTIKARAHVSGRGWLSWVSNNSVVGTTGERRRMEAVRISVRGVKPGLGVRYKAHLERVGWQNWAEDGEVAGYTGEHRQMEAIRIQLTGNSAGCSIRYRAHVAGKGWMPWVSNGSTAGTTGQGRRMEALQIQLNCS